MQYKLERHNTKIKSYAYIYGPTGFVRWAHRFNSWRGLSSLSNKAFHHVNSMPCTFLYFLRWRLLNLPSLTKRTLSLLSLDSSWSNWIRRYNPMLVLPALLFIPWWYPSTSLFVRTACMYTLQSVGVQTGPFIHVSLMYVVGCCSCMVDYVCRCMWGRARTIQNNFELYAYCGWS